MKRPPPRGGQQDTHAVALTPHGTDRLARTNTPRPATPSDSSRPTTPTPKFAAIGLRGPRGRPSASAAPQHPTSPVARRHPGDPGIITLGWRRALERDQPATACDGRRWRQDLLLRLHRQMGSPRERLERRDRRLVGRIADLAANFATPTDLSPVLEAVTAHAVEFIVQVRLGKVRHGQPSRHRDPQLARFQRVARRDHARTKHRSDALAPLADRGSSRARRPLHRSRSESIFDVAPP